MRRVIQCSAAIFFSACATFAIAGGYDYAKEDLNGYTLQPNLKVSDESDYTRSGHEFYLFGGYLYTDRFLSNSRLTATIPSSSVTYVPNNVFPSTFNGLQFGAGKAWGRHIDFQMSYFQHFASKKTSTLDGNSFTTSVKMNGILTDVGYVFNPDDQFQIMADIGAAVAEFYNTITVGGSPYTTNDDETTVNPAVGMQFLMQFTPHAGFRLSTTYIANTQTSLSSGEVSILAGFNYTL
ncbi:MAG: hypothetical protein A3F13_04240 [Gammaproteobacteria bacterium RIFCSPHIGHO2_12_FULL_40_19]|nr:MAG: hypothetical protein A3F13_04240 [Gammaproteobacteria bacterium RIFCSPHIGHO2_12_FULL_40_19]